MVLLDSANCWAMSLTLAPWARRSNTENSRSDSSVCNGRDSVRPTSNTMRSASAGSI
ncbi:hypothetical protein D9M71_678600 [compost metagenome]